MSADTKAMEEALHAAVSRMNGAAAEPQPGPADTLGALVSVLPKLLHNDEANEDLIEKIDALQKGDITALRGQVAALRKQCVRMLKFQQRLLARVQDIQRQQAAVAGAVLDLARQMARITFLEEGPAGEDEYERDAPLAPPPYGRAEFRSNGNGRGRRAAR